MICPHCKCKIETILGAPEEAKCYLAFCSVCNGVVKVEDNKLSILSAIDKIFYNRVKRQRLERHMCN